MSQASTTSALRLKAINQRRTRMFGSSYLKVYQSKPDGETLIGTFTKDWRAFRVWRTTDEGVKDGTAWQFEINAVTNWKTAQLFMMKATVLTVGDERFKIMKLQKPIGQSLVWKAKAEPQ